MTQTEWIWPAADGTRLHVCTRIPDCVPIPRAEVIIIHGIFEHGGRHAFLAEGLARCGYSSHAIDLRGHGRSDGPRGSIERFDQFLGDLAAFVSRLARGESAAPLFLFGHSMGGQIVLLYALARCAAAILDARGPLDADLADERIHRLKPKAAKLLRTSAAHAVLASTAAGTPMPAGVIASAAGIRPGRELFPALRLLAAPLSMLFPRLRLVRMGCRNISRDSRVVQAFRDDPLVFHDRFEVRIGAEALRAASLIRRFAELLFLPVLAIHGDADAVADPDGSRELIARAVASDKRLLLYPGLWHECLSEPERDGVRADVLRWLEERTTDR